jgi:hypothetical protein
MNIKNKLKNKFLMLSIILLKISALLILTEEQKALVLKCKDFAQYVLKAREYPYGAHAVLLLLQQ